LIGVIFDARDFLCVLLERDHGRPRKGVLVTTRAFSHDGPVALSAAPIEATEWQLEESAKDRFAGLRRRSVGLAIRRPSEQVVVAGMAWLAYMATAILVILRYHSIIGDTWSRVANAYYALYSRDPHLAAIGFVWNPLPSIAVMPLLPLKAFWPDIVATGFAASIVSALCMAGAVWQIHGIALDWGLRRSARLLVVLLFAFNPMILYYGANGMSEAMFIVTLVVSVRYLARWARTGETVALVVASLAMATAYLTRYEAVVAAAGAIGVVILLSARSRTGNLRERIEEGLADAAVFATPFVTVFLGWALASWLIVRDPFQQFTSIYGVVSQLAVAQSAVAHDTGQGTSSAYLWITHQLLGLEPGILILGLLGLAATFRGRWGLTVPAVAILGAVVAFAVFGFLTGRTLGWLRYSITVIPLASILAIAVLAPKPVEAKAPMEKAPMEGRPRTWGLPAVIGKAMGLAAVALVALAVPTGGLTMLDPGQNPQYGGEAFQLRPILFPAEALAKYTPFGQYQVGLQAASYLDGLQLARGTVLVDGAMGFPIILESNNPTQFVTTPDRDFQQALLDPVSFGVRYLLVPEDVGYQSLDAINRAYPGVYQTGAGISRLVRQFSAGGNNWRLYEITQ
jgi:hypothetical protein